MKVAWRTMKPCSFLHNLFPAVRTVCSWRFNEVSNCRKISSGSYERDIIMPTKNISTRSTSLTSVFKSINDCNDKIGDVQHELNLVAARIEKNVKDMEDNAREIERNVRDIEKVKSQIDNGVDIEFHKSYLFRLMDEKKTLMDEKKTLMDEKKTLEMRQDRLMDEKKTLEMRQDRLMDEKKTLEMKDPRSLFDNAVLTAPKTYTPEDGMMPFIDRDTELQKAWETLIDGMEGVSVGAYSGTTRKRILLLTGQMFGSGKTTFGKKLLDWGDSRIHHLFEHAMAGNCSFHKDRLRTALTVYIDLQTDLPLPLNTMDEFVSKLVFIKTMKQYFDVNELDAKTWWDNNRPDSISCVYMLSELVGASLFLHFDEMNLLLEQMKANNIHPSGEVSAADDRAELEMTYLYEFWSVVDRLSMRGTFLYLSGKSLVLNDIGRQKHTSSSPSPVHHLYLSTFTHDDISSILWDRNSNKATNFGEILLLNEAAVTRTSIWLHKMTDGIPRYVEYALRHMCEVTRKKAAVVNWEEYGEDAILNAIEQYPRSIPVFDSNPEVQAVLTAACYGLCYNDMSAIGADYLNYVRAAIDVASAIGVYATSVPGQEDSLQLIMPRLWRRKLVAPNNPLLQQFLTMPSSFMDKGSALELCVEGTIVVRATFHFFQSNQSSTRVTMSSVFPFLKNSLVGEDGLPAPSRFEMTKKATVRNRDRLMDELLESKAQCGCLVVVPMDKASTPDRFTITPATDGKASSVVGWEMKSYAAETPLTRKHLQKEINKFKCVVSSKGCGGGVLVVVCTGKGDAFVESVRGQLLHKKGNKKTRKGSDLNVPPNMEVLVLSIDDVKKFVGGAAFDRLKALK